MSDTEDSALQRQAMDFGVPLQADDLRDFFDEHLNFQQGLCLDNEDDLLNTVFPLVAGLCDPNTQPEDNDKTPLSVSCLADALIALAYQQLLEYNDEELDQEERPCIQSLRFQLSTIFLLILDAINVALKTDDPVRLETLLQELLYWEVRDPYWLPYSNQLNEHEVKLSYYMACVLILAIYKLFLPEDGSPYNPALNPYTDYFLRLWRSHTGIIMLAFELDEDLEHFAYLNKDEYFDTPDNVKRALLGSSAVRSVLAYILNQTSPGKYYDLKIIQDRKAHHYDICELPLLDFYDPLTRKRMCAGALNGSYDLFIFVQLILRFQMPTLRTRFDDFGDSVVNKGLLAYRYFQKRSKYIEQTPYSRSFDNNIVYNDSLDERIKYDFFGYADSEEEDEEDEGENSENNVRMALRAEPEETGIDESGVDWYDCARGQNTEFNEKFLANASQQPPFKDLALFVTSVETLITTKVDTKTIQHFINLIALCIKEEDQYKLEGLITPKKIYEYLVSPPTETSALHTPHNHVEAYIQHPTRFEYMLLKNPLAATSIIDEILMCSGFRRTFIWFLTHMVNYSPALLNYIYELALGVRGASEKAKLEIMFSRKGYLELSVIERLMLLHECFSNLLLWTIYFDSESHLRTKSLMCLASNMIKRLVEDGIISTSKSDLYIDNYKEEIEFLLVPFIGEVPEAREVFFYFKSGYKKTLKETQIWNKLIYKEAGTIEEILHDLNELELEDVSFLDCRSESTSSRITEFVKNISFALRRLHIDRKMNEARYSKEDHYEHIKDVVHDFRLFLLNYNVISHHTGLSEFSQKAKNERFLRDDGDCATLEHEGMTMRVMSCQPTIEELAGVAKRINNTESGPSEGKTKKKKKGKRK